MSDGLRRAGNLESEVLNLAMTANKTEVLIKFEPMSVKPEKVTSVK